MAVRSEKTPDTLILGGLRLMEEQVEFRKPVFGAGVPSTNETRIGITSPASGRQSVPAGFRKL